MIVQPILNARFRMANRKLYFVNRTLGGFSSRSGRGSERAVVVDNNNIIIIRLFVNSERAHRETCSLVFMVRLPTCSRQVGINYDKLGRRSPTMQRIHRIYGGAPAISCASASHAPKRHTTSPALWRAQCSLDLCSPFAQPSLDLRLTFAHPSLSRTATLRWLFGMVFGWG